MTGEKSNLCHCADNFITDPNQRNWIRKMVCQDLPIYNEFKDKPYCVLHYPSQEKTADFIQVFEDRLNKEDYVFDAVWFPYEINLPDEDFKKDVRFAGAVFSAKVNFSRTIFSTGVSFHSAVFAESSYFLDTVFGAGASFNSVNFGKYTNFGGAIFNGSADFGKSIFIDGWFHLSIFKGGTSFNNTRFSNYAGFIKTSFNNGASFNNSKFDNETTFKSSKFLDVAHFDSAVFSQKIYFDSTAFSKGVNFESCIFDEKSEVFFNQISLKEKANFRLATFRGHVNFNGQTNIIKEVDDTQQTNDVFATNETILDLQNARNEKPERILFRSVKLRPSWFINVDSRKIVFIDVSWENLQRKTFNANIRAELESIEKREIPAPHRLLTIACQQLAINAEENNRYSEASDFRYMAMETQRLEKFSGFAPWRLHWWYWLSSGYGEVWSRALFVLLSIWLLFSLIYISPLSSFAREEKNVENQQPVQEQKIRSLSLSESLVYSLGVITLQKPEPKPNDPFTKTVVILETVLGPLQVALLALAIRRKFMR